MPKKARRATHCPPTSFEKILMARLWYGDISHPTEFDGLHTLELGN